MSQNEYINFNKKLAFHSAPTLLGIKCASLISLLSDEFEIGYHSKMFNERAAVKGLKTRVLCECKKRTLMLVYNEKQLAKRLNNQEVKSMLAEHGYPLDASLEENLNYLAKRIKVCDNFPHEIGIFLDYPLEDVKGFIENKGENFKLCGCWKVYGSEDKAKRTFSNYKKCRDFLCNKLNDGIDIYQALRIS